MTKHAFKFGAYIAGAAIFVSLFAYLLDIDFQNRALRFVNWAIMIAGLFLAIRAYRDQEKKRDIKYGQALGFGTLTSLFMALINAVYTYLFLTVISPEAAEMLVDNIYEQYINSGMSESEAENAIQMAMPFLNPASISMFAVGEGVFMGFIFSLILGIFLKKENPNTFESAE